MSAEAIAGAQYLRHKYDILKLFLGDFIPDSDFFVGTKEDFHKGKQTKIYTIQDRVPDVRLGELSDEQLNNPILHDNMRHLLSRLSNMYLAMGIATARSGRAGSTLDGKLDIGGLSYISEQYAEKDNEEGLQEILRTPKILSSPNICIDPESLSIYLVDFDAGMWNEDMAASKRMIEQIAQSQPTIREIIETPAPHQQSSQVRQRRRLGRAAID